MQANFYMDLYAEVAVTNTCRVYNEKHLLGSRL